MILLLDHYTSGIAVVHTLFCEVHFMYVIPSCIRSMVLSISMINVGCCVYTIFIW